MIASPCPMKMYFPARCNGTFPPCPGRLAHREGTPVPSRHGAGKYRGTPGWYHHSEVGYYSTCVERTNF